MNTYEWAKAIVDYRINEDNLTDVIYTAHWRLTATSVTGVSAQTYGAQEIPAPTDGSAFIPLADITNDIVIGWLEALLDVPAIKLGLDAQIELIEHPVTGSTIIEN